jgi:hypothetical protein
MYGGGCQRPRIIISTTHIDEPATLDLEQRWLIMTRTPRLWATGR